MQNTFWVFIEDGYYRIFNGVLRYAPADTDSSIILDDQINVKSITFEKLEIVNKNLGSNFLLNNFKQ